MARRGRKFKSDEKFRHEFLDQYASHEPLYRPMPVHSRVMSYWVLDKYGMEDNTKNHKWARTHTQYFNPAMKSFKEEDYGTYLNTLRQKYKNHVVFATREDFNMAGDILKDVQKKLKERKEVTHGDYAQVQRVRLEIQKYLDEKERTDRHDLQDTIGEAGTWTEDQIAKGKERAKELNLVSDPLAE